MACIHGQKLVVFPGICFLLLSILSGTLYKVVDTLNKGTKYNDLYSIRDVRVLPTCVIMNRSLLIRHIILHTNIGFVR